MIYDLVNKSKVKYGKVRYATLFMLVSFPESQASRVGSGQKRVKRHGRVSASHLSSSLISRKVKA